MPVVLARPAIIGSPGGSTLQLDRQPHIPPRLRVTVLVSFVTSHDFIHPCPSSSTSSKPLRILAIEQSTHIIPTLPVIVPFDHPFDLTHRHVVFLIHHPDCESRKQHGDDSSIGRSRRVNRCDERPAAIPRSLFFRWSLPTVSGTGHAKNLHLWYDPCCSGTWKSLVKSGWRSTDSGY